jgi:protein-tyrosine phosphatase
MDRPEKSEIECGIARSHSIIYIPDQNSVFTRAGLNGADQSALKTFICMVEKKLILFVCLGNICRSPACERICRQVCGDRLTACSGSTSVVHVNEGPDERAIDVCLKHNIDIREHRAKQMTAFDWTRFDVIAALDQNVLNLLSRSKPTEARARVVLFNAPEGISDPY